VPTIPATQRQRVLHVVYPGTKLLDVSGPLQVFHDARRTDGAPGYEPVLVSRAGGGVATDVGVELDTRPLSRTRVGPADIVLVPGGAGVFEAVHDERLVRWLRERAPRARLVGSTCTGAFLLAAAGLLDGRRAVTHWDDCAELQRRHPAVRVEEDPIFLADAGVWTSAGVTAGIDLALALVEEDLGREAALDIARRLIVYSKRPGGQSQFSSRLQQQVEAERGSFEDLHEWVTEHLDRDLRVEQLAAKSRMSPRTFHRAYVEETGITPARMVTRARLEAARRRLEETDAGVARIARECGFGTEEHMRRTFQRELSVSPAGYREKWGR
jgi:transcriptional regulator GlxA family with amidase domain